MRANSLKCRQEGLFLSFDQDISQKSPKCPYFYILNIKKYIWTPLFLHNVLEYNPTLPKKFFAYIFISFLLIWFLPDADIQTNGVFAKYLLSHLLPMTVCRRCGQQFCVDANFSQSVIALFCRHHHHNHNHNHPHKHHHHQKHPNHHHDVSCLFVAALIGRCNKLLLHRQRQHQQSNANNIFRRRICLPKKYVLGLLFKAFIVIFSWNIWKPGILRPNPR